MPTLVTILNIGRTEELIAGNALAPGATLVVDLEDPEVQKELRNDIDYAVLPEAPGGGAAGDEYVTLWTSRFSATQAHFANEHSFLIGSSFALTNIFGFLCAVPSAQVLSGFDGAAGIEDLQFRARSHVFAAVAAPGPTVTATIGVREVTALPGGVVTVDPPFEEVTSGVLDTADAFYPFDDLEFVVPAGAESFVQTFKFNENPATNNQFLVHSTLEAKLL